MSKHTAGPWRLEELGSIIRGQDGYAIAQAYTTLEDDGSLMRANAEFIVRACNSHDDLLAALQAQESADAHFCNCHECGADLHGKVWFCAERDTLIAKAKTLREAAIVKAEGGGE